MTHVTCRLTAKNRDQLRTLRLVVEYRLPLPFYGVWGSAVSSSCGLWRIPVEKTLLYAFRVKIASDSNNLPSIVQ